MTRQPRNYIDAMEDNPRGGVVMSVAIQPFEQVDGFPSWDGVEADYVWGQAAVALGSHYDAYEDSEEWESELDRLEGELVKHAEQVMGDMFRVTLAPEYI